MTIYTFDNFWTKYHFVTKQRKINKEISRKLWDKTINKSIKIKAFDSITKDIKVNAYEYLLKELRNY